MPNFLQLFNFDTYLGYVLILLTGGTGTFERAGRFRLVHACRDRVGVDKIR